MASTIFRNKNNVRPKKTGTAKRARIKAQRNRLLGFGIEESIVDKMSPKEIREMLKYPAKISVTS